MLVLFLGNYKVQLDSSFIYDQSYSNVAPSLTLSFFACFIYVCCRLWQEDFEESTCLHVPYLNARGVLYGNSHRILPGNSNFDSHDCEELHDVSCTGLATETIS